MSTVMGKEIIQSTPEYRNIRYIPCVRLLISPGMYIED